MKWFISFLIATHVCFAAAIIAPGATKERAALIAPASTIIAPGATKERVAHIALAAAIIAPGATERALVMPVLIAPGVTAMITAGVVALTDFRIEELRLRKKTTICMKIDFH